MIQSEVELYPDSDIQQPLFACNGNEINEVRLPPCLVTLDEYSTTTGPNSKNLIIRQGVLKNNRYYYFNLTVATENGENENIFPGISTIALSPDELPRNGSCSLKKLEGDWNNDGDEQDLNRNIVEIIAVDDRIEFNCQNWDILADDKSVSYSIGISYQNDAVCRISTDLSIGYDHYISYYQYNVTMTS